jgi:hypothetical protein
VDELTGRDWLLFLLIQSCKLNELMKKILNLPDNEITLENVLALARKYESTEVACKRKGKSNRSKKALQPLRGGVHLRAQAELPGEGGYLHELQQEGPPRCQSAIMANV